MPQISLFSEWVEVKDDSLWYVITPAWGSIIWWHFAKLFSGPGQAVIWGTYIIIVTQRNYILELGFFYTVRITMHSCCEKSLLCNRSLKTDVKIKSKIAWTYKNSKLFFPLAYKNSKLFFYPYENIYGGNGRFSLLQFLLGVRVFSMDSSRLAESLRMVRKLSQCGRGVHSHLWQCSSVG